MSGIGKIAQFALVVGNLEFRWRNALHLDGFAPYPIVDVVTHQHRTHPIKIAVGAPGQQTRQ
jgi:hypothetical protein